MTEPPDHQKLRRLQAVGRELETEPDPDRILERVLQEARAMTGARFAAIGVLDAARLELERFLTSGVDPAVHQEIGELPHGRGVLGLLISDPEPLRLDDLSAHPQSYGFPPGHPAMRTFLGVPLMIRNEAWGNLYLSEKEDGSGFDDHDMQAATALAEWASAALERSGT